MIRIYFSALYRSVAQPGSVLEWGSSGRRFKSSHSDLKTIFKTSKFAKFRQNPEAFSFRIFFMRSAERQMLNGVSEIFNELYSDSENSYFLPIISKKDTTHLLKQMSEKKYLIRNNKKKSEIISNKKALSKKILSYFPILCLDLSLLLILIRCFDISSYFF